MPGPTIPQQHLHYNMSQQQDSRVRDTCLSSQDSREDEESYSNMATRGSSDAGSDDIEPSHTRSRSFDRRPRRPVISSLSQHIQTAQADDSNAADTARGISSRGNHSLIGLSPLSPLPHAMLPTRKRSLEEVLGDQSRPEKDKLSAEIDELAGKQPPSGPPESSSSARDISATGSHQRKKSRTSGEPSITRALPVRTGSSATNSEEHGNRGERRRSQRIRNASHHDKPSSSS